MSIRRIVERFCHGPRAALGLSVPHIGEGLPAELTLFAPEHHWKLAEEDLVSLSKNTPFLRHRFTGRPMGILANGQVVLAQALRKAVA
jgi:dihydroorotase